MKASLESLAADLLERRVLPKLRRHRDGGAATFPLFSEAGRWVPSDEPRWSDGFWPGLYWLAWQVSGEAPFRHAAEAAAARLRPAPDDPTANYDLGFLYAYGVALGHRLTGSAALRTRGLAAADRLCGLVCGPSGLITVRYPEREARFGAPRETTKIDVMMNLGLLWWAAVETGEARFLDVAVRHAERSMADLLRPDGSLWELADVDPQTGALLLRDSQEGQAGDSCWARAQAWAIHGFLQAAHHSGEQRFLDAARMALGFWRARLPSDDVPYWDLRAAQTDNEPRDASAAAIVLAGLAQARAASLCDPEAEVLIRETLQGLEGFLAPPEHDGLLNGGCAYHRKGEGLWGATVWGDYYLLEALSALAGRYEGWQERRV